MLKVRRVLLLGQGAVLEKGCLSTLEVLVMLSLLTWVPVSQVCLSASLRFILWCRHCHVHLSFLSKKRKGRWCLGHNYKCCSWVDSIWPKGKWHLIAAVSIPFVQMEELRPKEVAQLTRKWLSRAQLRQFACLQGLCSLCCVSLCLNEEPFDVEKTFLMLSSKGLPNKPRMLGIMQMFLKIREAANKDGERNTEPNWNMIMRLILMPLLSPYLQN